MTEIQHATKSSGMKVCGAGGGGCFLITHQESERELVKKIIEKTQMKVLDFKVEGPL
jgi:D-glycero-alpha-D-manno-heptose-7-phosphate kinase